MTLQELRYAVALADHANFARAAQACHVSPATLSIQLKKLEDTLGAALFDRSVRHVVPTAIGLEVVACARNMLAEAERIRELARQTKEPMALTLTLGAIPTLAPYFLPRVLPLLQRMFPKLRLLLREEQTAVMLDKLGKGQLDAALLALPVPAQSLEVTPLFAEEFLLATSAKQTLTKNTKAKTDDLRGAPMLLLEEGHCLREQALEICGSLSHVNDQVRATSLETLRQMVGMGLGCTLMPALAAKALGESGRSKRVTYQPFRNPAPVRHIALVWRKRSPRAQPLRRIAAAIKDYLPEGVTAL
jgi:LysR family transcriptional regulator, hydrogen peroxide-inducible genes activator